jgi:hypothetical protein
MSNEPGILAMANYHRKAAEFILPETMGDFFKERTELINMQLLWLLHCHMLVLICHPAPPFNGLK